MPAARALLWPPARARSLLPMCIWAGHGKFRAAGVPLPGGHSAHDLDRLTSADRCACDSGHLVVLGDLIHARQSYTALLDQKFRQFRTQHRDIDITLVRGNHDRPTLATRRQAGALPCRAIPSLGPFACLHEPADSATQQRRRCADARSSYRGHLHPAFRLTTSRERCASLLWRHHRGVVLPSFGSFTGSSPVPLDIGESLQLWWRGNTLHHLTAWIRLGNHQKALEKLWLMRENPVVTR